MHLRTIALFVVCIWASVDGRLKPSEIVERNEQYLERTLNALGKAMDFFAKHHADLNLDAVIGTRIVEGQFSVLLKNVIHSQRYIISPVILQTISDIRDIAGSVSALATPYIRERSPDYYNRVGATLDKHFWEIDHSSRDVDKTLATPSNDDWEAMHEQESDECLSEIFGSGNKRKCNISDSCWNLMTSPGYQGYSLSHQIFYLEIGEKFGCEVEMAEKVAQNHQVSLRHLQDVFCANMLLNAERIADAGFPKHKQDLFMEQGALCGMLGYRQFTLSGWLEAILSWQRPMGCFGETSEYELYHQSAGSNAFKRRVRREERALDDNCLAHATAVAVSSLTQYVRFIVEYTDIQRQVSDPLDI